MSKETLLVNPPVPKFSGFSHSFDTGIAMICGLEAAVVYNNLVYWLINNKVSGKNLINGKTWSYDTHERIAQYLPYMNPRQIKYALNKLIDSGIIIKAHHHPDKFNKTNWYALVDETPLKYSNYFCDETNLSDRSTKSESSMEQNCLIDKTNLSDPHNTDTILTDTINTSSKVPKEPSAIADKEDLKPPEFKRYKKPITFPAEVRELADKILNSLVKHNPDYRPPGSMEQFLNQVRLLMLKDERTADRILAVLEWALMDNVERNDFKGWSSIIYSKNPPETLRKHFAKIAKQMDAKPNRKFAPSSDDSKALKVMEEMTRNAII